MFIFILESPSYKPQPSYSNHCAYLVAVPLVDEEPLPLPAVGHLERVLAHQRVEERVVFLGECALLGSQDTAWGVV